jgi:hypothetical protein
MAIRSTIRRIVDYMTSSLMARLDQVDSKLTALDRHLEQLQMAVGQLQAAQTRTGLRLQDHEYQVFSQWGEDGIIQFLIAQVNVRKKIFVEFGVENYREANTRFLLMKDNWTGLVFDADSDNIARVRSSMLCWRHGLRAVTATITRDNINSLITQQGISGEIGLLSIDIDGNDYWVWQAIDVVNPEIVVIEYNHRFGEKLAVTIPYNENFRRGEQHPKIYFGASLRALVALGKSKGYAFVGCNSNGVNAFFVRRDRMPESLKELTVEEGFVAGTFSETSDERGLFLPPQPDEERRLVTSLPLVDVGHGN